MGERGWGSIVFVPLVGVGAVAGLGVEEEVVEVVEEGIGVQRSVLLPKDTEPPLRDDTSA